MILSADLVLNCMAFLFLAQSRFGLGAAYIRELDKISSIWKKLILEVFASARLSFRNGDVNIQELDKSSSIWKKMIRNTNEMTRIDEPTSFVSIFISFMSTIIVILLLREFALNSVFFLTSFESYSLWNEVIDYLYQSTLAHLPAANLLYLDMRYLIQLIDRTFLLPIKSGLAQVCSVLLTLTFSVTVAYILDSDNIQQSSERPVLDAEMVWIQKILNAISFSNNSRFHLYQRHVVFQANKKTAPADLHDEPSSPISSILWQLDVIDVR